MKKINKILWLILILILLLIGFIVVYISDPLISARVDALSKKIAADNEPANNKTTSNNSSKKKENKKANNNTNKKNEVKSQKEEEEPEFDIDLDSEKVFDDLSVAKPGLNSEYEPSDESALQVPDELRKKSGYTVIKGELDKSEEEADDIDEGNTGDDYTFDGLFYPYYEMLNEKGQHVYRQIYANAIDLNKTFKPVEQVTPSELKNIFCAVVFDHPELFWVNTGYSGLYSPKGYCTKLDLDFNKTSRNLDDSKQKFEKEADSIIAKAKSESSDYDKEKLVHNELANQIIYNLNSELNQSAYSALVNDDTVCAGYARAFQYIMTELGIPCYFCAGFAGENHAWNIIKLDNDFYNVDVTWDDSDPLSYDYFNKSDADYSKDHSRRDLSVYLPACKGSAYSNLEKAPVDENIQNVIDAGVSEDAIFDDIDSYYAYCYDNLVKAGKGNHEFKCVIRGRSLFDTLYRQYDNGSYKEAYMDKAVKDSPADNITMYLDIEELSKGYYLVIHEFNAN